MPVATPRSGRLSSLDGLRGVAALVVVVHHSMLVVPEFANAYVQRATPTSLGWFIYSPVHLVWAGSEAVWVFFVLSGLVLTRAVMSRSPFDWRAYYPSRLLRLYLPVAGAVAFSVLVAIAVPRTFSPGMDYWIAMHSGAVSVVHIVRDVTLLGGVDLSLNSALWSLQWEVMFSLLLPLFVWVAIRSRSWVTLVAAAVVVTFGEMLFASSSSFAARNIGGALLFLPIFLVGCVFARRLEQIQRLSVVLTRQKMGSAAWVGLLLLAVVALTLPWTISRGLYAPGTWVTAPATLLGAALFVLLAIGWPAARALLESGPIRWLGRISFSLYLVHEPLVVSIGLLLPAEARWATVFIAVPVALLLGWGFFRVVEGPSHRLAQAVSRRVARQPARIGQTIG